MEAPDLGFETKQTKEETFGNYYISFDSVLV